MEILETDFLPLLALLLPVRLAMSFRLGLCSPATLMAERDC